MNKIIKLIILSTIFITYISAKITNVEVDNLMKMSNAGLLLQNIKASVRMKAYLTFLMFEDFPKKKSLDSIKKENAERKAEQLVADIKYVNIYKSYFLNLDEQTYEGMLDFYASDVGQKIITRDNAGQTNKEVLSEYKRIKDIPLSKYKLIILEDIIRNSNIIQEKMKYKEKSFKVTNSIMGYNYSDDELKMMAKKHKSKIIEYEKKLQRVVYENFSEKELQKVFLYLTSKAGKMETKLMLEAGADLRVVLLKDLSFEVDKEMNKVREMMLKNTKKY